MTETRAHRFPQYSAAFAATTGAFAMGSFLGWSSPAEPKMSQLPFYVNEEDFSWIGSLFTLGAACTCIPIGIFVNITGRKWTMLFLVIPFTAAWIMITWPPNLMTICIGRFIGGLASGAFCIAAPIYTAEISEKEIRGTTGFLLQLNITMGILFSYVVGSFCSLVLFSSLCGLIPIAFAIFFFWMPESPFFLLYKGKSEAANKAMRFFRGKHYNFDGEMEHMKESIANGELSVNPFKNIGSFKRKATIKAFIICMALMFFQQLSGINAVIFYSTDLFAKAKGIDQRLGTIIIGIVQVIASFSSTLIVDNVGRRFLLIMSGFIMSLCTLVLGLYFYLEKHDPKGVSNVGWVTVIIICLFLIMFAIGLGPVPWLMVGELFAPDARGIGGSISGTFCWSLAFVVTKSYPDLIEVIGPYGAFWCFTVISLIGTIFFFFVVPETRGITLRQIQLELAK